METLVIRAPGIIQNPDPSIPKLPDIDTGIYLDLSAETLTGDNGSPVSSWIATGSAPEVRRTFASKSSQFDWPTLQLTGAPGSKPCVLFEGDDAPFSQIYSQINDFIDLTGPVTVAAFVNLLPSTAGSGRLLFCSEPQDFIFRPHSTEATQWTITAGGSFATVNRPTGWAAIVAVFDGADSIFVTRSGVQTFSAGTPLELGGTWILGPRGTPSNGLRGSVARLRVYDRALTRADAQALVSVLEADL